MFSSLRFLMLIAALAVTTACSPAYTGVNGNTLTTNLTPGVSITAHPPLALAGHGRLWVSPESDTIENTALASFSYAFYADTTSGPVPHFAYAAIVRLTDAESWYFEPQQQGTTNMRAGDNATGPGWTTQTLAVSSQGDWPSDVWRANKREAPETWLTKRWIASLDDGTRAIAEYREAWPQCLEGFVLDRFLIGGKEGECLTAFAKRAQAAFNLGAAPAHIDTTPAPASPLLLPDAMPNIGRLAGKIQRVDRSGDSSFN